MTTPSFPTLLQGFFTNRLMQQRQASPHTLSSYRDSFRLLLQFAQKRLGVAPQKLAFEQVDAPLIAAFLEEMQTDRGITATSRNLRLTAIRSFFRYASFEMPTHAAQIQRVLSIPNKRCTRTQIGFLNREEIDALLRSPDLSTRSGRRDHTLMLLAVQTGLRLSEITGLCRRAVSLGTTGSHVRVVGKGRKERSTPLTKSTADILRSWLREIEAGDDAIVFPSARGTRLSADGVQYLLAKHVAHACKTCKSLGEKKVTPHVLRHTMAMELLQAGVERTVIALWLGHESIETTQVYLEANLEMKQAALDKVEPQPGRTGRFRPSDKLLAFLDAL